MFISSSSASPVPTTFSGRVLRFIARFVFWWLAALLVACLIAVAFVVLVLSLVRGLITGRKASPAMVFGNFKRYAPEGMWPGQGRRPASAPSPDAAPTINPRGRRNAVSVADSVVDVEARDIPDSKTR